MLCRGDWLPHAVAGASENTLVGVLSLPIDRPNLKPAEMLRRAPVATACKSRSDNYILTHVVTTDGLPCVQSEKFLSDTAMRGLEGTAVRSSRGTVAGLSSGSCTRFADSSTRCRIQ